MPKPLFVSMVAIGCLLTVDATVAQAVDPGIRTVGTPGGNGLPGLNATESQLFNNGFGGFGASSDIATGLGPRFNGVSCSQCHTHPGLGGSSPLSSNPQEIMISSLA